MAHDFEKIAGRMQFPLCAVTALIILISVECSPGSWMPPEDLPPGKVLSLSASYQLGNTEIIVLEHRRAGSDLIFFNMHDDENTAVEAALHVLSQQGGRLIEIRHGGKRLVEFQLGGQTYVFDPNRMFTDEGARKTLERFGPYSEEAFRELRNFADRILLDFTLDQSVPILTLHNNTPDEYSTLSYLPDGDFAAEAENVFLEQDSDPDDFFFVTDPDYFEFFKNIGQNVVLQDNQNVTDDGSLSVLAGARGIPYVNLEAEHGHLQEQVEMLELVYDAVRTIQRK